MALSGRVARFVIARRRISTYAKMRPSNGLLSSLPACVSRLSLSPTGEDSTPVSVVVAADRLRMPVFCSRSTKHRRWLSRESIRYKRQLRSLEFLGPV